MKFRDFSGLLNTVGCRHGGPGCSPAEGLALLRQDERKRKKKGKEEWEDKKKESKEFRMGRGVVVQMEEVRGPSSIPLHPPLSFSSCFFPPRSFS